MKQTTKVSITVVVAVEHDKQITLGEVENIASVAVRCGWPFGIGKSGTFSVNELERRTEFVP